MMRDTRKLRGTKSTAVVSVKCPNCQQIFRMSHAKLDAPAICMHCSARIEEPSLYREDPELVKLAIPLKGSIVTSSGTIELDKVEAASAAYTGGRSGFSAEHNPALVMASRRTDVTRTPIIRRTAKIRRVKYSAITIMLITLMAAGLIVFIWQMAVYITREQAVH